MTIILLRGIVGAGKTGVGKCIEQQYGALRLSVDDVPLHVTLDDTVKLGDPFRTDDAFKNQQRFVYNVVLYLATHQGQDPALVTEKLVRSAPYITLSDAEQASLQAYVRAKLNKPHDLVTIEGTFSNPDQLKHFYDTIDPKPIIIEVQVEESVIRSRLTLRGIENESRAAINIYDALLPLWKDAKTLGYDGVFFVDNSSDWNATQANIEGVMGRLGLSRKA